MEATAMQDRANARGQWKAPSSAGGTMSTDSVAGGSDIGMRDSGYSRRYLERQLQQPPDRTVDLVSVHCRAHAWPGV